MVLLKTQFGFEKILNLSYPLPIKKAFCQSFNQIYEGLQIMPQIVMPLFPKGVTHINNLIAFICENGVVTYFNGMMPVFQHDEDDIQTFKMIMSQFYITGVAKQAEIIRATGIAPIMLKRAVQTYRTEGPAGFYKEKKGRGPRVLHSKVIQEIEDRLQHGEDLEKIVDDCKLKLDTVQRAIRKGIIKKKAQS
jgi:hypothetical protein